jgi:hypothetical protein
MLKGLRPGAASAVADVMIIVVPHLGILDSWLPILDELKRREAPVSVSAVVPDRKRLVRSQREDFLLDHCNALVDSVFTRMFGEPWTRFETFHQAAIYARERDSHSPGRQSRRIEELYHRFPHAMTVLDRWTPKAKVVLSDVSLLDRPTMEPLRHKLRRASWFSLPHGIDPRVPPLRSGTRSGTCGLDITIYASSELEAAHYEESCGVPNSRIKVVGVPRHSKQWLRRLRDSYGSQAEKGKFIYVASRPVHKTSFPPAKKTDALQALRALSHELNCILLVRPHPAETEVDRAIIERALGKERMGESWSYSLLPAIVAADGALFAVTMFSSVAVDMLAIDVPAIELFDFSHLTDTPSLVPDVKGRLTSIYRRAGLVLAASNFPELKEKASEILADRNTILTKLKLAYGRSYADPRNSMDIVVGDITEALSSPL